MAGYDRVDKYPTIEFALEQKTVDELKKLAALFETKGTPTRKAEVINYIAGHLRGEKLFETWDKLDDLQKAAVAETVHSSDCFFYADRFNAKYGTLPVFHTKGKWEYDKNPTLLSLFFYRHIMPDDLKEQLKAFVPKPVETKLKLANELPTHFKMIECHWDYDTRKRYEEVKEIPIDVRETERTAQQDLITVLRLVDAGKVSVSDKTFRASDSSMKVIADVLQGGDFYDPKIDEGKDKYDQKIGAIKPFAFPLLLQAAKLAKLSSKKLALTPAGRKALSEPAHETLRSIWQRWITNKLIDEFNRIDEIKGQHGKGKRSMTSAERRREVISTALKECAVNEWMGFKDFSRFMLASGFYFDITRDPWSLYICEHGYGSLGNSGGDEWYILQERYLLCLLFEYAATLGMIDVAYIEPDGAKGDYGDLWGTDDMSFLSRYDGLLYFRVNPLGAYCLELTDSYTPPKIEITTKLTVLPSLKVMVTSGTLSTEEELLFETYAERLSTNEWMLDLTKTMEAVENGRTPSAELKEFLEARDEQPLPESVERFIKDAEDKNRQLQSKGEAIIIDCGSKETAELLANNERLKKYCLTTGTRNLVVYSNSEAQFRKALHQFGYCWRKS